MPWPLFDYSVGWVIRRFICNNDSTAGNSVRIDKLPSALYKLSAPNIYNEKYHGLLNC